MLDKETKIDLEDTSRAIIDLLASRNATHKDALCVLEWVKEGLKGQKVQPSTE